MDQRAELESTLWIEDVRTVRSRVAHKAARSDHVRDL